MKLPLKWLKEYVDFNVSVDRFVELMMWRGFETAAVEPEMPVTHTVVGRIDALSKHPNADKLQICSIDVGQPEKLTVVTGATNVFEGALVPGGPGWGQAGGRAGDPPHQDAGGA